jgi:hypothetical protein
MYMDVDMDKDLDKDMDTDMDTDMDMDMDKDMDMDMVMDMDDDRIGELGRIYVKKVRKTRSLADLVLALSTKYVKALQRR